MYRSFEFELDENTMIEVYNGIAGGMFITKEICSFTGEERDFIIASVNIETLIEFNKKLTEFLNKTVESN